MECMGQLTVIHDVRLREFGALFRVVMVPKGTPYFTAAESVGAADESVLAQLRATVASSPAYSGFRHSASFVFSGRKGVAARTSYQTIVTRGRL